jgi:hypothetical protein
MRLNVHEWISKVHQDLFLRPRMDGFTGFLISPTEWQGVISVRVSGLAGLVSENRQASNDPTYQNPFL